MSISYPTSLDTLSNPAASHTLDNVTTPHATQHANANDAIEALEAKLGIGASTPTLGDVLQGTAAGTTAFGRMQLVNLLVNGGFEVWQRGTSFAGMATAAYGPDRWNWTKGGTSTLDMAQESTIIDAASRYSLKLTYTHNAASTVQQKLEDPYQLRGKTLTVSMKVRANAASAVRLRIDDSAGSGTAGSYHTGGSTFETLTATKAIAAAATTVTLTIELNATVTAYLDNAMLVFGSVAVDYVPLSPAEDIERCRRYAEMLGGEDANQSFAAGFHGSATAGYWYLGYHKKGGIPSFTVGGSASFYSFSAVSSGAVSSLSFSQPTSVGVLANSGSLSGLTAGQGAILRSNNTALSTILVEWNP